MYLISYLEAQHIRSLSDLRVYNSSITSCTQIHTYALRYVHTYTGTAVYVHTELHSGAFLGALGSLHVHMYLNEEAPTWLAVLGHRS